MSSAVRELRVGDELYAAMLVLRRIIGSTPVAIVAVDDVGMHVLPMPGREVEVLRALADANWTSMIRIAEEMTG